MLHDVFIRDDLAFVSDIADPGGLVILDLTDLDNPVTISSVAVPEGTHSAGMRRITCTSTRSLADGRGFFASSI